MSIVGLPDPRTDTLQSSGNPPQLIFVHDTPSPRPPTPTSSGCDRLRLIRMPRARFQRQRARPRSNSAALLRAAKVWGDCRWWQRARADGVRLETAIWLVKAAVLGGFGGWKTTSSHSSEVQKNTNTSDTHIGCSSIYRFKEIHTVLASKVTG